MTLLVNSWTVGSHSLETSSHPINENNMPPMMFELLPDFHDIWFEHHATRDHPTILISCYS